MEKKTNHHLNTDNEERIPNGQTYAKECGAVQ
jgi:hypothetical protein